ncbi:MAG TPA: FHA domain-containing protein, partial [Acidobacteria bacterium]|nr:FHA domain-containing protein [Acidobacteriota bacterium]
MTANENGNALGLRHRGRVIPLNDGDHLVGRGGDCTVRIPSVTVSRHHVRIRVQDGRVVVIDMGSRNGTWLNRERLRPNEPREMAVGDHIYLPAEDLCLVRVSDELGEGHRPCEDGPRSFPDAHPGSMKLEPGGARRRFLAAMIDMVIFGAMSTVLAVPLVLDFPKLPVSGSLLDSLATVSGDHAWMHLLFVTLGVWVVLWLLYFTIGWGMLGATPGQAIMGLRLIDHKQRYPIGLARALLRLVAYSVGSLPLMAGHLLVIGRSDKRALHDMLAGTR